MEFSSTEKTVPRSREPSKSQFCMICLDTSAACKLYSANTYNLDLEFEHLTGISLESVMLFVPQFCTICAQRLSNSRKLRDKCLRAYHLLMELVEVNKLLTTDNIKTLNRSNNLTSSMGKRSFQPDHCDLYLIHQEQEPDIQELPHSKSIKTEEKLLDTKLVLNPDLEDENNVENEVKTKDIQTDDLVDFDLDDQTDNLENIDVDIQSNERVYNRVDLSNKKTMKMEVESVNGKLIRNPDLENEVEVKNQLKMDNLYDEQTDDLENVDMDIDILDKRVKHKDMYRNCVVNDTDNCIYLKVVENSHLESGVNDEADTETVKMPPAIVTNSKIKAIQKRTVKPKAVKKGKNPVKVDQEFSKQFKVTEMTHEEQLTDLQKRKETANFQNSLYKCVECFKGFRSGNVFNTHKDKHTDKFGKVICLVCGLHYPTQHKLNEHVSRVHRMKYSCTSCSLVTSHKMAAINHQNWHNGVIYTCPHCQEKRRSKTGYLSHLRIMHPTDVVCTVCGFSFLNQKGLGLHVKRKHRDHDVENPDGPLCEPCDIRFASDAAYQQHMQVSLKHSAGKLLKRNTPKQNYTRADKTEDELNSETKLLSCEQCGVQLHGFRSYNHHFKTQHPGEPRAQHPPHKPSAVTSQCLCEKCGQSFLTKHTLKFHMTSKHSGKKEFKCDVCQKTFCLRRYLALHLKTHSGDQPLHQCPVCQKKFNLRANCKRHIWTHAARKPHACATCARSFADAAALRSHVRHYHYKTPYPKKRRA
ncbi:zinc finger protein 62 homolog isoform X2 [Maniola jurtina]|uniref:zinc finger protein 62 homolog isoform X2 n=1 Tax=Maniola jurtina TaxID=191418 RepID=UPI001E68B5E9|nr:zinc finger protein 62 homolog isoform X2 [Maniola jurtina]